jgi:hypothetical protein
MNWHQQLDDDCDVTTASVCYACLSKDLKKTVTEWWAASVKREPTCRDAWRLLALKAFSLETETGMKQETAEVLMHVLVSTKSVLATVVLPATEVPHHRLVTLLAERLVADTFVVQAEDKVGGWRVVAAGSDSKQVVYTVPLAPAREVWPTPQH